MQKFYVLSEDDTKELLNMEEVIEAVENVYIEKSQESGKVFPLVFHEFERAVADMDIKSGTLDSMGVYGLKLVSWFGANQEKGLPSLSGVVMVIDRETGIPMGVINAEHMTGMRTGAAGALGCKYLAREDSKTLLMVGAGHQASFQIRATQALMSGIEKVMVYDPINYENSIKFVADFNHKKEGIEYVAVENLEEAVGNADIIITATPSRKPMIMKEWVKEGTHFSCIGSDLEGKQEIDNHILKVAKLVTDDIGQSISVGEFETGIKNGIIAKEDILCEIGDVITGKTSVRTTDKDITVYDSTGIGLQDIAVGYIAINKAIKMDLDRGIQF